MAGRIPQTFLDDLLARTNIVDVVDSRVKLKKAGKNYHACCPFHNEKTPSFTVAGDKQFYYCFGCGAKGNAVSFVMEYDNVDFPTAVDTLAGALGMEVPKEELSPHQQQQAKQRTSLYDLMEAANRYYQQQLRFHPERQASVDYLKNRGLSGKAAKFFQIGFAPQGWDNLKNALAFDDKQLDDDKHQGLISAGMLIEKEQGGSYDRFRNRIVFPIRDIRGRTIGFGARTLGDEKPKYLNSPETPIFNKGHELYGLYECRQIRQPLKRFLVVEGYMDVVALHEYGLHYAVATLGTATSETHLQKLFKIAPEVVFCFDGDAAGQRAARRALEIVLPILEDGQQVRFLFLPDGEDPDSMVRKEGKEHFEQRIQHAEPIADFLLNTLKEDIDDPDSLDGRARLAKLAAPMIQPIPGIALRSLFWQALSEATRLDKDALKEMAAEVVKKQDQQHARAQAQRNLSPKPASLHPHDYSESAPDDSGHWSDAPAQVEPYWLQGEQNDEPITTGSALAEHPLLKKAIALVLHAPATAGHVKDLSFLQHYAGHWGDMLNNLITGLQQSPRKDLLATLSLFSADPNFNELKTIAENHNRHEGHLSQEQAALDTLTKLKHLADAQELKNQRASLSRLGANTSARTLDDEQRQKLMQSLRQAEKRALEDKMKKKGGFDALSPEEQAKYSSLTNLSH